MGSEDKIEFEEKKTKRYRLGDGLEFFVIDDLEEAETEGKLSARELAAGGKRSTKRKFHALVVKDPEFGTMPYHVWEERRKMSVLGIMSAHGDIPHADIPHSDSITLTPSSAMREIQLCKQCGRIIPFDEPRCPDCGSLSPATG